MQREFDGRRYVNGIATPSAVHGSHGVGAITKKNLDCVYFLKNVHAAIASNMMAMTHRDESLIPVFLAMRNILS